MARRRNVHTTDEDLTAYGLRGQQWLQGYMAALSSVRELTLVADVMNPAWRHSIINQLDTIERISRELVAYAPVPARVQLAHTKYQVAAAQMHRMVEEYRKVLAAANLVLLQAATEALDAADRALRAGTRELEAVVEGHDRILTGEDLEDQQVAVGYLHIALARAEYKILDDSTVFSSIPGFQGVWANEKTFAACHKELEAALQDWINYRLAHGLDLPELTDTPMPVTLVDAVTLVAA